MERALSQVGASRAEERQGWATLEMAATLGARVVDDEWRAACPQAAIDGHLDSAVDDELRGSGLVKRRPNREIFDDLRLQIEEEVESFLDDLSVEVGEGQFVEISAVLRF